MSTQNTSAHPRTPVRELVDFVPVKFSLVEGSQNGKVVVRGEFAKCGVATENRRVYSQPLWESEFRRLSTALRERRVLGELDHPSDGALKLARVSHVITSLEVRDGIVEGTAEILPTETGRTLLALINAGCKVGVSSRGSGSTVKNDSGYDVVQEDYRLQTFDFVAEPADKDAYPVVVEGVQNGRKLFEGCEICPPPPSPSPTVPSDDGAKASMQDSVTPASASASSTPATGDLRDAVAEHMLEVFAEQEAMLRERIRGEMLSDPTVASARRVVEELKSSLLPLLLPEDVQGVLRLKDEEISKLQRKIAEQDLTIADLAMKHEKLSETTKTLACRYHLETSLASLHPFAADVRAVAGDAAAVADVTVWRDRVKEAVTNGVRKFEEARVASDKTSLEEANTSHALELSGLQEKLVEHSTRNKQLEEALAKSIEATDLLRIEQKGLVEFVEMMRPIKQAKDIQDFVEERLENHEKDREIRRRIRSTKPSSKEEVLRIIAEAEHVPVRDVQDIETARSNVRGRLGGRGGWSPTALDEERSIHTTPSPERSVPDLEREIGMSLSDYRNIVNPQ